MNIKKLKSLIAKLPDDMIVLTPSWDHGYRSVNIVNDKEILYNDDDGDYTESHWKTQKEIDAACGTGYIRMKALIIE